jgi:hypothetical protein
VTRTCCNRYKSDSFLGIPGLPAAGSPTTTQRCCREPCQTATCTGICSIEAAHKAAMRQYHNHTSALPSTLPCSCASLPQSRRSRQLINFSVHCACHQIPCSCFTAQPCSKVMHPLACS